MKVRSPACPDFLRAGLLIPFQITALLGIWIWNRLAARCGRLLALQIGGSAWILLCLLAILLPEMPISGEALAAANRGPLVLLLVSLMDRMIDVGACSTPSGVR